MLAEKSKKIYQSLNGLRGLAILLVFLVHSEIGFNIGWVGVPIFFVLSGFLITGSLFELRISNNYFRNFYISRAFRIFPIYYLCFFVSLLICVYNKYNMRHWKYFAMYLQNWMYALKCWSADFLSYFGHTWTLAIEEQFYLIWPFCLFLFRKRNSMILLSLFIIFLSVLSKFIFAYKVAYCFNYLNTLSSCDYLISGALISILLENKNPSLPFKWNLISYLSFSILVILILIGNTINFEQGDLFYVFFHIFLCISIFLFVLSLVKIEIEKGNNFLVKILSSQPLVFVGKISYGLYLYHCFIFHWVNEYKILNLQNEVTLKFIKLVIVYVSSFLVATISFYMIEKPLMSFKYKFIK